MAELSKSLETFKDSNNLDQAAAIEEIARLGVEAGYTVADIDTSRPWGGFVRFDYKDGDTFVHEFFPGVNPVEARLGNPDAELSPKILYVLPEQRLSWQRHDRRAERWVFLTDGYYHKSNNPEEMGDAILAQAGTVVQFEAGECHRLVGNKDGVTYVAEIWQHTDADSPSDESDIERLADDYKR